MRFTRGPARPAVTAAVAVLALIAAGCTASSGDDQQQGPAASPAVGDANLANAGCPSKIVIQGGYFPTMDIGVPFQLLGGDWKVDAGKKRVSGSLVFHGKDTGVDLEFRSGGPAVGFQNGPAVAYQDPSINLVFANIDEIIAGWAKAPMQAVVAPMNGDPQALIYDPAQHRDWANLSDIGQTDTKVLYNNASRAAFAYLVGTGLLRQSQVDSSFDGSPSQFVAARGSIVVQGYATNEVGVYEHLPQWGKPVAYFLIQNSGYPNYAGTLAIRPADKDKLAPCLRKLVPIIQQAQIDMMADPAPAEAKVVKAISDFKSIFVYPAPAAQFGMCQIVTEGLVGNPKSGPLGTLEPTKLTRMITALRPALATQHVDVPADLTADTLGTNEFLDPNRKLPLGSPKWSNGCPGRSG